MSKTDRVETAPKPTRVTSPFTTLEGQITYNPLAYQVSHQPVILNHQELDATQEQTNPMLGRALQAGIGLKDGDFECSGGNLVNVVYDQGTQAQCGNCLLIVNDAGK